MANTKLNPPIIESKLNAQYGVQLEIPFQMNRSVSIGEVSNMTATVKTIASSRVLSGISVNRFSPSTNGYILYLDVPDGLLTVGQYYKVQIAYMNGDNIGFYSSAGTFKYTSEPKVEIKNLSLGTTNKHTYTYTGVYFSNDSAEKAYSYRFRLYNLSGTVLSDSGILLHDSTKDEDVNSSEDTWTTNYSLSYTEACELEYSVTTINGLEISSERYRIIDNQTVESNVFKYYDFIATNIPESACVELSLKAKNGYGDKLINGQFLLLRASDEDDYATWSQVTSFVLASWNSYVNKFICRDYTVNQGTTYKYALQAYNNKGVYSKREEADPVTIDFEDIFLSDGEKQLRVRFNPKITSFKNTVLETKTDTIGSKYPFFFRNGNVKYKEFPISGLISILSDENSDFVGGIKLTENSRAATPSLEAMEPGDATDLSGRNFKRERDFKTSVLEWLTNGQPKLFRSPAEGSYIVRLMNTSLSPNDTLSRMLHTFSSTAYEIAECNFDNLRKYGMMVTETLELRDLEIKQVLLAATGTKLTLDEAVLATISNGTPGMEFYCEFKYDKEKKYFQLGRTGQLEFDHDALVENPLISIAPAGSWSWGDATLIYGYYNEPQTTNFSSVKDVLVTDVVQQLIGRKNVNNVLVDEVAEMLKDDPNEILYNIGQVYYLKVAERNVIDIEADSGCSYNSTSGCWTYTRSNGSTVAATKCDILRQAKSDGSGIYYYYGGYGLRVTDSPDVTLIINGDQVDMNGQSGGAVTQGRIIFTNLDKLDNLYLGNGLYCDIVYQFTTKVYIEEESGIPLYWKTLYEEAVYGSEERVKYWNNYYEALVKALQVSEEGMIVNAI